MRVGAHFIWCCRVPLQPLSRYPVLVVEGAIPTDAVILGVTAVFGVMLAAGRTMWTRLREKDAQHEANLRAFLASIYSLDTALRENARAINSILEGRNGSSPPKDRTG